jgi:hypothetical protein
MSNATPEQRAYSRGYAAAARKVRVWPPHKPPLPPDPIVGDLVKAAQELRDAVDGEMATFEEGDEMAERLYAKVDALDETMRRLTLWLQECEE